MPNRRGELSAKGRVGGHSLGTHESDVLSLCRGPEVHDHAKIVEALDQQISIRLNGQLVELGSHYPAFLNCHNSSVGPRRIWQSFQNCGGCIDGDRASRISDSCHLYSVGSDDQVRVAPVLCIANTLVRLLVSTWNLLRQSVGRLKLHVQHQAVPRREVDVFPRACASRPFQKTPRCHVQKQILIRGDKHSVGRTGASTEIRFRSCLVGPNGELDPIYRSACTSICEMKEEETSGGGK